ncbi:sigma-70 family RNA polymerase sigma factor [Agriterribacter sp.]|uniref:RNA polymerase sigma factor n=1 Tax=Agriterribacter sp. TaxID=2821509 RepID=UPI002BA24913|nr:sigma-70 family RNA polymerase sigma factor [Agriterribacter sp.]HRP56076.1 sigma-70 family RNA polymerase sigma factor [Agriterribacter sp.]
MASSQYDHITDTGLLENYYADGNNKWLGILMQRYTLLLYGVCMKYLKHEEEAKDAVQQIFLKVISELQKYRVTYFKSWLYMVARNYCLMQLRDKEKIPLPVTEKMLGSEPDENSNLAVHRQKDAALSALDEALEELNEDQKQCIMLFYLQKRSYNEIALITGYSPMQIKSHIQNGKRNLKIIMGKKMKKNIV